MGRGGHSTGDDSAEGHPARLAEDARFAEFLGPSFEASTFVSQALSSVGGNAQARDPSLKVLHTLWPLDLS